jgi:WD40 repeat protein
MLAILAPISTDAQESHTTNFPIITPANINSLTEIETTFTPDRGVVQDSLRFIDDKTVQVVGGRGFVYTWNIDRYPERANNNFGYASRALMGTSTGLVLCVCSEPYMHNDIQHVDLETGARSMLIEDIGVVWDWTLDADERLLAVAAGWTKMDGGFPVWNLREPRQIFYTTLGYQWTPAIAFHPTDSHILAVGYQYEIELWNIETNEKILTVEQTLPMTVEYGSYVLDVGDIAFSPGGRMFASMAPEGFIWLWDVTTGENLQLLRDESIHVDTCGCYGLADAKLAFNPNGSLLAATNDDTLRLWDVSTGQLLRTIDQPVADLAFNESGTLLSTVSGHGAIKFWSISEGSA